METKYSPIDQTKQAYSTKCMNWLLLIHRDISYAIYCHLISICVYNVIEYVNCHLCFVLPFCTSHLDCAGVHLYPKSTVAQARPSSKTTLALAKWHSKWRRYSPLTYMTLFASAEGACAILKLFINKWSWQIVYFRRIDIDRRHSRGWNDGRICDRATAKVHPWLCMFYMWITYNALFHVLQCPWCSRPRRDRACPLGVRLHRRHECDLATRPKSRVASSPSVPTWTVPTTIPR